MKLSDFERDILDPMASYITTFDRMRPWVAYQDVVNLFDLITMLDHWIGGRIQKLYEIGENPEKYEVLALDARIGSLHKALIEFANIFMTVRTTTSYYRMYPRQISGVAKSCKH